MDVVSLLLVVIALAAGAAVGFLLARSRSGALLAERDGARREADAVRAERDAFAARASAAETEAAGLAATVEAERRAVEEKAALLERAEAQLKESFQALSAQVLEGNTKQFLELATGALKQVNAEAKGDLEQRRLAVEHLVAPLKESLAKVEVQLRDVEQARTRSQAMLAEQITAVRQTGEQLRLETGALVDALRKPQARGRWGELQLKRAVEHAGMTDRTDFFEQETVSTADGLLRPDMIIKLVGGKQIVVDSKVTLAAYLEAHEATDARIRDERLAAHAKHLRQHVDQLAAKAYWSQFSAAPEFVVLFVPGEAFLAPALEQDPTLLDYAFSKRVHIATPTTLVSLLRTAAYAWQQDALADNAREVFEVGRELYSRLGKLGAKFETLGKRLTSTVGAYNETVGSLERTVLPQARRFRDLKVVEDALPEQRPVEEPVRSIAAPELVAGAESDRQLVALRPETGVDPGHSEIDLDAVWPPSAAGDARTRGESGPAAAGA